MLMVVLRYLFFGTHIFYRIYVRRSSYKLDLWSYLSLFTFFMVNFSYSRVTSFKWFIGWEGVGLMFFPIKLIIGFLDLKANAAALKANNN